jgi:hypothetical protein
MVKINYQREKRRKDLDRQRKQEEKRARKLNKDAVPDTTGVVPGIQEEPFASESPDGPESSALG